MKLNFERLYPYIFAVIAGILWHESGLKFPTSDPILSANLSVAGVFVGFLATAKAIFMSMNSPIIADLKKSGYIKELVAYIGQAIWLNLIFCVVNVIGFFGVQSASLYSIVWVMCAVGALTSFIRVAHIMLQIFKYQ